MPRILLCTRSYCILLMSELWTHSEWLENVIDILKSQLENKNRIFIRCWFSLKRESTIYSEREWTTWNRKLTCLSIWRAERGISRRTRSRMGRVTFQASVEMGKLNDIVSSSFQGAESGPGVLAQDIWECHVIFMHYTTNMNNIIKRLFILYFGSTLNFPFSFSFHEKSFTK